jgi:hypothetical protein
MCAMPLEGVGAGVVCEPGTEIGSAAVPRFKGPSSVDSIPSFRTLFVGMPGLLKYRSLWRPVGSGLQPAVSSITASFRFHGQHQRRAHPQIARCRSEHGRTRTKRSMGWRGDCSGDMDWHPVPDREFAPSSSTNWTFAPGTTTGRQSARLSQCAGTPPGVGSQPPPLDIGSRHPCACSATPARTIEPGSPLK